MGKKWIYETKRIKCSTNLEMLKDLKDLGQDGWELIQLINKRKGKITAILKKEN